MESRALTAVLWDFGGVLTTSPFDAFAAFETASSLPPGFIRKLNSTNPDTNAWARLERNQATVEQFVAAFELEAKEAGYSIDATDLLATLSGKLRPAMVEAVRRCHARLKTALLTNNFMAGGVTHSEPDTPSGYAPVLDLFDVVIESSKTGIRKPDPRFYQAACEQLGIHPADAVMLDDLGVNLKPARAMGMRTIKVVDPDAALAELEQVVGFPLR
jgi:putative hydrolase of the HAD superfamily